MVLNAVGSQSKSKNEVNFLKPSALLIIVVFIAVFYFLTVLPQRRQQKARQAMMNQLQPGMRVVTVGGIYATVVRAADSMVEAEISNGVVIEIDQRAIARVVEDSLSRTSVEQEQPTWQTSEEAEEETNAAPVLAEHSDSEVTQGKEEKDEE